MPKYHATPRGQIVSQVGPFSAPKWDRFACRSPGLNYPGSTTNPVLTAPVPNGLGFGPIFSQYQVMQIAPALVYDVNDQLSVSFSPQLDLGNLQLAPSVISAPNDANGDTFATYPAGMHSRQAWGAGFAIGTYYKADDFWGFGASIDECIVAVRGIFAWL